MPLPIPAPRESGDTPSQPPLYFARYGKPGAAELVVLHGGPGASHDYLLPQMLALGEHYDLLFYDQRGGGRSRGDDTEQVGWRTHVHDLARVALEFRLTPLTLVGYSWGGLLAMLYAIEAAHDANFPSVRRLVLIDPAPITREHRNAFESEFARRQASEPIASMRRELQTSGLQNRDLDAYRRRAFELSVAGYFADPEKARDLTPFRVVGKVQQSVWQSLGAYDLRDQLRPVHVPTLIVHGSDDPIPLASSEAAADALGTAVVTLPDCGHVPYVERPDLLFPAVLDFLARTD